MQSKIPFAIIGTEDTISLDGTKEGRGRKYPWGVVDGIDYSSPSAAIEP